MISMFKYYELINFNIFHMIQSDTVYSLPSFLLFFFFSQNIPILANGNWLFSHCNIALVTFDSFLSFWYYTMFQTQPLYFLFHLDAILVISPKDHKSLDKLKSAIPVTCYSRQHKCYKAFLRAELDIRKHNSIVSLYLLMGTPSSMPILQLL